ncbi:TetR/AcrR family transcriptional regulator [Gordonia rhizosphera]|uniref:Putative TetR family transcriptional regulator n=1 Tax=Gordonia rhizosphera NBRC 16068 TaxID=1108045 RepID=K6WZL8_9ACTN|nr:TetR/AcrR family transcriptional regulator [Gordonia rhizosphera]GAB92004.1 putative TetR family transcriptional regulator [Gordonia rhizosphera NBRC 16068]
MTTEAGSGARRTNRRGLATREAMLDAALEALASGEPGSVSANRIAKAAGATWGTVKYQFGDVDGLWAAVLRRTAERRGGLPYRENNTAPLAQRVTEIIETLFVGLTSSVDARAIENLRAALPREHAELERLYPKTAAELASWKETWAQACAKAFADLDVDPARVREVAAFIPGAMRGLASESQLGSYQDEELARRGLANAIVAYLEPPLSD